MSYLAENKIIAPDFFINAEQKEMKIVVAYKGCAWMEVKVKGVTAHGSKPHLGVNAVVNAAKLIYKMCIRDSIYGSGIPFLAWVSDTSKTYFSVYHVPLSFNKAMPFVPLLIYLRIF